MTDDTRQMLEDLGVDVERAEHRRRVLAWCRGRAWWEHHLSGHYVAMWSGYVREWLYAYEQGALR